MDHGLVAFLDVPCFSKNKNKILLLLLLLLLTVTLLMLVLLLLLPLLLLLLLLATITTHNNDTNSSHSANMRPGDCGLILRNKTRALLANNSCLSGQLIVTLQS